MTSTISRIKNNFMKYTAYRTFILKNRNTMLILAGILSYPLFFFSGALMENAQRAARKTWETMGQTGVYPSTTGFDIFFGISVALAVLSAFVIFMIIYTSGRTCFEYFNSREKVDKSWSLPVKSKHRFWGDFISGIAPVAIVYILSAAVGLLIAQIGFAEVFKEMIARGEPHPIPAVIAAMFIGLLFFISVYIIVVFCASLCGKGFETAFYPLIICGIIPALVALFGFMAFSGVWQVSVYEQINTVLFATSPFGFLVGGAIQLFEGVENWNTAETWKLSEHLIFLKPSIIVPFIIMNAGFLTSAFYMSKRREAENTGKAFAFKRAAVIIISLIVFCLTAAFCLIMKETEELNGGSIFGLIAVTLVAFLIFDVSAKRGFKRMGKAFGAYGIMLAVSIGVSIGLLNLNGFGIGEYIPPADRVESVEIRLQSYDTDSFRIWDRRYYDNNMTEFTNSEIINAMREINTASNEKFKNSNNSYFRSHYEGGWQDNGQVTYTLTNGKTVSRYYRINKDGAKQLIPLLASPEYKQGNIAPFDAALKDGATADGLSIYTIDNDSLGIKANVDIKRIYEAFKQDYLAETFEQKFYSTGKTFGRMIIFFTGHTSSNDAYNTIRSRSIGQIEFYVREHYTNLLAELERQGITFPEPAEIEEMVIYEYSYILARDGYMSEFAGSYEAHYYDYEEYHDYYDGSHKGGYYVSPNTLTPQDPETAALMKQLAEVSQPLCLVDGEGYTIFFKGNGFIVPPQYNNLAEQLLTLAKKQFDEQWEVRTYEWGGRYVVPKEGYTEQRTHEVFDVQLKAA